MAMLSALALFAWGDGAEGFLMGALGAGLVASGVGVARLRAWGVLLAMVLGVASVVVATLANAGVPMLTFALPGALLAFPLFAAFWRTRTQTPSRARSVGARALGVEAGTRADAPRRVRVADVGVHVGDGDEEESAAAPPTLRVLAR
jgi:hypothetical protein